MKSRFLKLVFISCIISFLSSMYASDSENTEHKIYEMGVYIYSKSLSKHEKSYPELAKRCSEIGITEAYLGFSELKYASDSLNGAKIDSLISSLHSENIKVYALSFDDPLIIFSKKNITDKINSILAYNSKCSEHGKFDGISADIEPHMLKKGSQFKNLPLYWVKDGYDSSNLSLIELALAACKTINSNNAKLPICQAIPLFYTRNFKFPVIEKFISAGCSFILLMIYKNEISSVISAASSVLAAEKNKNSIMVCIKTSSGTKGGGGDETTFAYSNKEDLEKYINEINEKCSKYESYRGIAFFELEGLLKIIERK